MKAAALLPMASRRGVRCDDPLDRSGGLQNPLVMSKLSLQTVKTYVGDDSSASHLDESYSFSYQDLPFTDCTDSVSLSPAYCAGSHLLTSITPTVYQNGTGHTRPGTTFGYTGTQQNSSTDTTQTVGGNPFHAVTNWRYLDSYHDQSNGVGGTVQYHTAWNNSNGTPHTSDGDNRYDALFCDWHATECTQAPFAPLITSPAGDLTMDHYASTEGWDSPATDAGNYTSGQLYDEEVYQGNAINDAKLFTKTATTYAGTNGTASSCSSTYTKSPYTACELIALSTRTTQYEQTGSSNANAPWTESDDTHDDYTSSGGLGDHHQAPATGFYHNLQQEVISSSNAPTLTKQWTYDTTNTTVGSTVYYDVDQVAHSDLVDASGHVWQCADTTYDQGVASGVPTPAAGWPTTEAAYSNCANQSSSAIKTYTGYDGNGNVVASVDGVGAANPGLYSSAGCTLSTAPQFFPTGSWSSSHYTDCTGYDATSSLPTDTWNAFAQHSSTTYDATQGLLPITVTDVNSQVTSTAYSYDSNGNATVSIKQPGEVGSSTGQSTLVSTCTSSSTLLCVEEDGSTALYSNAVTRTYYDSLGRQVETLTPGPDSSHTTVSFTVYDDQTHSVFSSVPFVVASRSTWLDPNGATDDAGVTPGGTMMVLDALGRTISVTDALSHQSTVSYGLGTSGVSGDTNTYATTTRVDANLHVQQGFADALGRSIYVILDSGTSGGTLTPNQRTAYQYNALDEPTSVTVTDLAPQNGQSVTSVTTTASYDDLGRMTSLNDPDRGAHTYSYDPDGRLVGEISGSRTLGSSYDLLGRLGCLQDALPTADAHGACSSGANPFVRNTYDADPAGVTWSGSSYPVGQLTQSVATTYYPSPDNTQGIVTENMQYDQRGRPVIQRMQISASGGFLAFPSFPLYQEAFSSNDANQETTVQTTVGGQAGYVFTNAYDGTTGVLNGLSNTATGTPTLAALTSNTRALISDVTLKDSSGGESRRRESAV
jgi:YD repeat-containing protein